MSSGTKKRVEISVDAHLVPLIRASATQSNCEDFTISPVISGWGPKGYWSSERAFASIGSKVTIRFTAEEELVRPMLANGFGILSMQLIHIGENSVAA